MTVDNYILSLKPLNISIADLEMFDIGGILDLITEYLWQNTEHEKEANQSDFDSF